MSDKLISQIHRIFIKSKRTVSVAESCTGGLLSYSLTSRPGASKYFLLGLVVYSNASKVKILDVPDKLIKKYGAVSKETADSMSQNLRKKSGSDFALSITGIAGPTGATKEKPVGTVFISLSENKQTICWKFSFRGNREKIRKKAAHRALQLLCARLLR